MNNKEAIRRTKLYLEGLEKAIAQPLPEASAKELDEIIHDPEGDEEHQSILCLWKEVIAPLDVAIAFIHDNRVLPQYKEHVIHDEAEMPFVPYDEMYDTLRTLILPTVGEFLSVLPISSGQRDELLDCVERGDKDGFVALLEQTHCDTMPLARLCSHCTDDVMAGLKMTDEERVLSLDHLVGTVCADDNNERCRQAAADLQPYLEQSGLDSEQSEQNPSEAEDSFNTDFLTFIVSQLMNDLHYYWDHYDLFTMKERNLIEPLLEHPLAVDLVNELWNEYRANLPFDLPDDFFSLKCVADDTEHLYLKPPIKTKGVETFNEFVNFVAEKGYIENSPSVKQLFVYRLSGRLRPEGDLPPIVWNGKNGKSYELIYIIRYLCDVASYKKMRCFFEGPEWVKDKDSSYAKAADTNFRLKMSEFYPGDCPF